MTFEERVRALDSLGFTPRQTRFLVTVALHSGFCLRRQYAAFAGVKVGKNVSEFLEALVGRGLARRLQFEVNRGHVYHLHARTIYRALQQDENRNRRVAAPALIARKVMLLDFVVGEPAEEWFATEADKVALFEQRLHVPHAHLPRRVYLRSGREDAPTARCFVHKLPIFLAGDPPLIHFGFLATEAGERPFTQFLWDHRGLLAHLPGWAVVVVGPRRAPGLQACRAVFDRFISGTLRPRALADGAELRWYFAARRAVDAEDVRALSVKVIDRFHAARRQFAGTLFESLYADWLAHGDEAIARAEQPATLPVDGRGQLLIRELPFSYRQFGALPGVV